MRIKKLLVAAVLVTAIGVTIVGFVGDVNMAQPADHASYPSQGRAAALLIRARHCNSSATQTTGA